MYNINLDEKGENSMAGNDTNVWQDAWGSMQTTFKTGLSNAGESLNKGVSLWGQQAIADFFHTPSGDKIKHDATAKGIGEMIMDNWKIIAAVIGIIILIVIVSRRK